MNGQQLAICSGDPAYLDAMRIFIVLGLVILATALVLDYGWSLVEERRKDKK